MTPAPMAALPAELRVIAWAVANVVFVGLLSGQTFERFGAAMPPSPEPTVVDPSGAVTPASPVTLVSAPVPPELPSATDPPPSGVTVVDASMGVDASPCCCPAGGLGLELEHAATPSARPATEEWKEVRELNASKDPSYMEPGTKAGRADRRAGHLFHSIAAVQSRLP